MAERVVMESASDLLVLNCNSFVNVASIVVREVLIQLWVGAGVASAVDGSGALVAVGVVAGG